MIKYVAFDTEIDLYWDKVFGLDEKLVYSIFIDGKKAGTTEKTHFESYDLSPSTEYEAVIVAEYEDGRVYERYDAVRVKTQMKKKRLDVTELPYGAIGDGRTLNTRALQKALDDCRPDEVVYLPRGVYVTGSLTVHGDTEIFLDEGAVIQGSLDFNDYLPKTLSRFEGYEFERYRALVNIGKIDNAGGYNVKNVVIRGNGKIFGGGKSLCDAIIADEKEKLKKYLASLGDKLNEYECDNTIPGRARPFLIDINNAHNVVIRGLEIGFGPSWNVHMTYSDNVITSGATICSEGVWNGDGWDPDSSTNCTVYDCVFKTHDDAIAVKSGKNPEGNVINRPCKDIRIFDCHGWNGVAIGSEMSGGIENVYVWQCEFDNSVWGIRIKTTSKRGGYVKNVYMEDVVASDLAVEASYTCNDDGEASEELPRLENFYFKNITLTERHGRGNFRPVLQIVGLKERSCPVKNVVLKNVTAYPEPNGKKRQVVFDNVVDLTIENVNFL